MGVELLDHLLPFAVLAGDDPAALFALAVGRGVGRSGHGKRGRGGEGQKAAAIDHAQSQCHNRPDVKLRRP